MLRNYVESPLGPALRRRRLLSVSLFSLLRRRVERHVDARATYVARKFVVLSVQRFSLFSAYRVLSACWRVFSIKLVLLSF
jgi:hypothetical protein